jgi:lipoprotein-anchoring transpeptidase ErfK/SrfK
MSLAEPLTRLASDRSNPEEVVEEKDRVPEEPESRSASGNLGSLLEKKGDSEKEGDSGGSPGRREANGGAPLWVEVDIAQQRVRVWKEGALLREMVASTGLPESPTPTGVFRLENRGRFFFSKKYGQGGWWWVSFLNRGEYLFHSVPTDEKGRLIPEEAEKLGQPASHGCVRLSLEDAKWFYDHLPEDTPVVIR